MQRISLLDIAHQQVSAVLATGDLALDATVGNGHDTAILAQLVGVSGHVYGFDIQPQALTNTRQRLQQLELMERVTLLQVNHAELQNHIPAPLQRQFTAIMFNLGYLPGSDKTIITQHHSSVTAIAAACELLNERGVLTILCYPGHAGGAQELLAVNSFCQQLAKSLFWVEIVNSQHQQQHAPQLFVIRRHRLLLS